MIRSHSKNINSDDEIRPICGFEGKYEISKSGQVFSLYFRNTRKRQQLKTGRNHPGYYFVVLCKNAKPTIHSIHRLIAQAFIPNPFGYEQVNHINGIKDDNRIENLEWVTRSQNAFHAYRVLKHKAPMTGRFGKDNPFSKPVQARDAAGNVHNFAGIMEAARKVNGDASSIVKAAKGILKTTRGYSWRYI